MLSSPLLIALHLLRYHLVSARPVWQTAGSVSPELGLSNVERTVDQNVHGIQDSTNLMDPEMQCGLTAPAILERKNQANLTSGRFTKSVLKKGKSAKIASGDSCATVGKEANLLGYLEPQQQNAKKSVCWRETLVEFLGPASEKEKAENSITRSVDTGNEEQSTGAAEAGGGTRIFNRDSELVCTPSAKRKVPLPFFLDFLLNMGIMLPDFSFTSILEPFWDSRAENAVLRRSDKLSLGGESYHGEEGMLLKCNEREGMKIGSTSPHETCKSSEEKEFETARSGTEIINEEGRTDQAMQEEFLHQFRSLVLEDIPYARPQEVYKKILEHEFQ
ncbi:hypothetical protein Pst134EA_004704 [Puccinia striiformis f. sp. tritici]|uniref:hypothetical protein n=1 Tax=Puccinia striiformis f. sp. tritici TaxID=168172 RepID=UPI0020080103|nr:hypothetical protein Pst134EA_004704 [Puccinia striiformis f. sp. tritici]KAH9470782.1 hypothetical protein Pst134EA_004704 [Puccinia striiformis f. sp. tritici]